MDALKTLLALFVLLKWSFPGSHGNVICHHDDSIQSITARTAGCERYTASVSGAGSNTPLFRTFRMRPASASRCNRAIRDPFLSHLRVILGLLQPAKEAWTTVPGYNPLPNVGLQELNPIAPVRDSAPGDNSILKDLRWLHTSIEAYVKLVHYAGQLGPSFGNILSINMERLSGHIDHILHSCNVRVTDLPMETNCRVIESLTINSRSHLIEFTSLVLRDVSNALERVHQVMTSCSVPRGAQSVYVSCSHNSLFYDDLPFGNEGSDRTLYDIEHFRNLSRA